MSDAVRDVHQEFWRPPLSQPTAATTLAEACRRCGTEFMVGAAFCHICGASRHRADLSVHRTWTSHFAFLKAMEFARVKNWFGLPVASMCALLVGAACLIAALSMVFVPVNSASDIEVVQLWRIQWLMAACAAFLAGILIKNRKPEN